MSFVPLTPLTYHNVVHFIGELSGVNGFDGMTVFAKWKIETSSDKWRILEGTDTGRTWLAERDAPEDDGVWNEPINVAYATSGLIGWPKVVLEIYSSDMNGGVDFGKFLLGFTSLCLHLFSLLLSFGLFY